MSQNWSAALPTQTEIDEKLSVKEQFELYLWKFKKTVSINWSSALSTQTKIDGKLSVVEQVEMYLEEFKNECAQYVRDELRFKSNGVLEFPNYMEHEARVLVLNDVCSKYSHVAVSVSSYMWTPMAQLKMHDDYYVPDDKNPFDIDDINKFDRILIGPISKVDSRDSNIEWKQMKTVDAMPERESFFKVLKK